jgi:hypothetical protein
MGLIKWENGGPLYATFYCRFLSVYVPTDILCEVSLGKTHLQEQEKREDVSLP